MQLNTLCPLLLLGLSQVASAGPNDAANVHAVKNLMSTYGITKRANILLAEPMEPPKQHYRATEAVPVGGGGKKRQAQTCSSGFFACTDFPGSCCDTGTYCVQIGATVGCCDIGQTCDSLICNDTQTTCGSYCCDSGDPCTTRNGEQICTSQTSCTLDGYVMCPNLNICCPEGVDCIPPNSCNIPCTPDDPPCGSGCCTQGQVCQSDDICGPGTSGTFTPLGPSNTGTPSGTPTGTPTGTPDSSAPLVTTKRTTTTEDTTSATPTGESTSDSYPNTTPRISLPRTQTVTPNNAASIPTMGALLGGLGIAAGYLAM